jgi:hypothetical protein
MTVYRLFTPEQASKLMEFCDANNIDYDIWNGEDCFILGAERIEISTDWSKIPPELC